MPMWILLAYGVFSFIIGVVIGEKMGVRKIKQRVGSFPVLARFIAQKEGLRKQVNIAQINEILKIVLNQLGL